MPKKIGVSFNVPQNIQELIQGVFGGYIQKFANEENIATYLEFLITIFCSPLIANIKRAPINGINIIAERIGKFI